MEKSSLAPTPVASRSFGVRFLDSVDAWTHQSNPSQAPRCESCYVSRVKGERRSGRNSPFKEEEAEKEDKNSVGPRSSKLWAKLAELRELPIHDSLAAFPEGVGES